MILRNLIVVIGLQVFVGNSAVTPSAALLSSSSRPQLAAFPPGPPPSPCCRRPACRTSIADAHLGALPSTLIAAAVSGLLAIVVGLPLMRTSTLAIPISTFAFLIVVYNVVANWDRVTGGSSGLVSIPTTTSVESAALWAGAAVVLALAFKWSASGYRLQASREDEVAARSIGIGLIRERLIAFNDQRDALRDRRRTGGTSVRRPLLPTTFYFAASVTTITMLVVGGSRSVLGAVVGTLAVATVNDGGP